MTVDLRIGRLTIEMPTGRRLDSGALKTAIERELAARIKTGGAPGIAGGGDKSVTVSHRRPSGPWSEAQVAESVAGRIYEAAKR